MSAHKEFKYLKKKVKILLEVFMNKDVCYAYNILLNMLKVHLNLFVRDSKGGKQSSQEGKAEDKVHVKI